MINYRNNIDGITPQMLKGFFVGWTRKPSSEKLLEIIKNSDYIILAFDTDKDKVVGLINAISDGELSAYIPLLEVLPEYQRQGIGKELVNKMLIGLKDYYMIDLCCDERLVKFYRRFGMKKMPAMSVRNFQNQGGKFAVK